MSALAKYYYPRSLAVIALLGAGLWLALGETRLVWWSALLPLFEWMESTVFGVIGQTWGAAFATVQAIHLLGMALLGGSVVVADGRLLGLLLTDSPASEVQDQCHRLFIWALFLTIATGIFMACGVAIKIYYLNVFWYKMLALSAGVAFVYGIRRPLLRQGLDAIHPRIVKLVAVASLMLWFTVAATGRWIGFSG